MQHPNNLKEALVLFSEDIKAQYSPQEAQILLSHTETSINRYALLGWGFAPPKGRKFTLEEKAAAEAFQKTISLEQLITAAEAQEKAFDLLQVSPTSRAAYRSRLKKFLTWCSHTPWWPEQNRPSPTLRCPRMRGRGYGSIKTTRLVDQPKFSSYYLKPSEMNPQLKAEIDKYHQFRTAPHWPNRLEQPIKLKVADTEKTMILQILGWLHRFQGFPLDQLSLDLIITPVQLKSAQDREAARLKAEEAKEDAEQLFCDYFNFLEQRGARSLYTRQHILCVLMAVAKFQYHRETTSDHYRDIPVIERLRSRSSKLAKELKHQTPVADQQKKWLELPEVLSKIVEPLRAECFLRSSWGKLRRQTPIAESFKRYILWGCFVYAPPRRQQELRKLKIALSCPIKRPSGVGPDDLIHPLPTGRERDRNCGYLYRTPQGKWIKDITPESYKTGATYGHQEIEIPNIKFPDGKCFYDYLEAWLYGYYIAPDGGWRSCGNSFHPQGESKQRHITN